MISLSSGLLQFVSNASLVTPSASNATTPYNGLQKLSALADSMQSAKTSAPPSGTSAVLAQDTYTPSSQNPGSNSETNSANSLPGISDSVVTAMEAAMAKNSANYDILAYSRGELYTSMTAGSLSDAQSAYADFMHALEDPVYQESSLTTASQQFMSGMQSLGVALQAGDMSSAESIYSNIHGGPNNIQTAYAMAYGAIEYDSETATYGLTAAYGNGSAYQLNTVQLASDVQNYTAVMQENATLMSRYLVSQGFSSHDANEFAAAASQVSLPTGGSPETNNTSTAAITAQWIQAISQNAARLAATHNSAGIDDGSMIRLFNQALESVWTSQRDQIPEAVDGLRSTTSSATQDSENATNSVQ